MQFVLDGSVAIREKCQRRIDRMQAQITWKLSGLICCAVRAT